MEHSFTLWLQSEVMACRCSLLSLLEQRDKLSFQEGPRLEESYMKEVGTYEEEVLRQELEVEILEKKQQMIQTAINRREIVDENAIDQRLDELRQKMIQELSGEAPAAYTSLSDEQSDELQGLYHQIVKGYHPQTHPDLPQAHRELFQKAQIAYRCRDLDALRLIYEMLIASDEESVSEVLSQILSSLEQPDHSPSPAHFTDYSLSSRLYKNFCQTEEDIILIEEKTRYQKEADLLLEEITSMRKTFPFSAAEMLSDPQKIQAYRDELSHRMYSAKQRHDARKEEIAQMMKGALTHE